MNRKNHKMKKIKEVLGLQTRSSLDSSPSQQKVNLCV